METWKTRLDDLLAELELAGSWNDRYRELVAWGEALEPLAEGERTDELLVTGCSSPLWFRVSWDEGHLAVAGASTGVLARALTAVAVRLFDGLEAQGLADLPANADLVKALGFDRNLSPTRAFVFEGLLDRCRAGARR